MASTKQPANPSKSPPAPRIVRANVVPQLQHIPARFMRPHRRAAPIWLVIHATHGAEGAGKAVAGALELQRLKVTTPRAQQRSTHLIIDTSAIVQCVPYESEAWHAGSHGNQFGIGIELCGSADQSRAEWFDAASLPMLNIAATILRKLADQFLIPLAFREGEDLVNRVPGVTTHAALVKAFPHDSTHYDPGPNFPITELIAAASA
jgi:hypothetical protein